MADEAKTRLERLREQCKLRGWVQDDGASPSPGDLSAAISRSVTYCSDLLRDRRSFGEKTARHIEDSLGLPRYYLDGGVNSMSDRKDWPFQQLDPSDFFALEVWQQIEIQGAVRAMIERFNNDKKTDLGNKRKA